MARSRRAPAIPVPAIDAAPPRSGAASPPMPARRGSVAPPRRHVCAWCRFVPATTASATPASTTWPSAELRPGRDHVLTAAALHCSASMAVLVLLRDAVPLVRFALGDAATLGRASDC